MKLKRSVCIAAVAIVSGVVPAAADVVTDWNAAALAAIRSARPSPPVASRALAILHIAIYDAVNGVGRRYQPYFVPSTVPASASIEAAAAAAAHRVLVALFPTGAAEFDLLLVRSLEQLRKGPQQAAGVEWGTKVAEQVLALRANDGWNATVEPSFNGFLGAWVPTPPAFAAYLNPQWGFVAPFAMRSSDQFRPPGPPAFATAEWTAEFNEVKTLGAAVGSARTAEQSQIARFWADGAGTETPPGHWNHIAADLAALTGNTVEENARLFALLNIALADAAISAWDAKYTYNFWRPVTAIRAADTDGNPATVMDATWSSFIVTPPFPDYVSGHSAFSAAAATVLALFYGRDEITFEARSDTLPGAVRVFSKFSDAATEAAMSRVYGGIHFRSASEDGLTAGSSIGLWTYSNFMLPKGNRSRK